MTLHQQTSAVTHWDRTREPFEQSYVNGLSMQFILVDRQWPIHAACWVEGSRVKYNNNVIIIVEVLCFSLGGGVVQKSLKNDTTSSV